MADWKQITARIRRARTGKDPATQLSNLYQKTRDAMVAFELARFFETAGQNGEAAKWYSTAAERFRRADWKTKAQEAAVRLGGQPDGPPVTLPDDSHFASPAVAVPEPGMPFAQTANTFEAIVAPAEEIPAEAAAPSPTAAGTRTGSARRRGRRGGRNRRHTSTGAKGAALPAAQDIPLSTHQPAPPVDEIPEPRFGRVSESVSSLKLPVDPLSESSGPSLRGRYGDPGLSSRLSLLEMQFRRLLSCSPLQLDSAERAPAGPGVLLLSDSDLTTNYYVEACQTLRVAIANLLRGGASRRGADSLKPQLADHLGIAETRVPKYLADHCVVRYLQLDDHASYFAHFVIAVLRPTLNE
jgi:hypothetical protein